MCEIDGLMKRIKERHDPLDKRLLERIIKDSRDKVKLEDEVEKLKPFKAVAESLTA